MLATVLAAVLAAVPSPAPKPIPTPAPPPVIEGTVRGPTGVPVKEAVVVARARADDMWDRGEPPMATRTDREGRFRIVLKKSAPVEVQVQAVGLAPRALPRVFPGKRLEISLEKGRLLQGVVRDGISGKPIAGARVQSFTRRRWESTLDQLEGLRQAVTDANGRFKLEGLGAGPVTVTASRPGYGRTGRTGILAGTRLELLLLPGSSILGLVRGADGKGVSGASVQAESDTWLPPLPEITDGDGRFELIGLKPGTYRVWAHRPGLGTSLIEEATLESEADTRVILRIDPASNLEGRLVAAGGKPLVGKLTVIELDGSRSYRVGNVLQAESGADGRFRLGDLPPGSHALAARAEGFAPKRVEITIPAGQAETVDLGEIELERGLTIRGRVVDKAGSPVAGARILGWFSNTSSEVVPDAISEADGTFVLAGLEPGLYTLYLTAVGYGGQRREAESGAENVLFSLQPAGTIAGQVVDERGAAVEAFRVWARPQRDEHGVINWEGQKSVESNDGRFTLEDLAEGVYRVEAFAEGKRPGSVKDVAVKPGVTADAGRIRLEPGGTIRGVVVDTRGAPISSATVSAAGSGFRSTEPSEASSGLDGGFEIQGVPFGPVEVFASHPDFATGKSEALTVEPGRDPVTTRIVLSAGGRVEGHARQRDGDSIVGARVQLTSTDLGRRGPLFRQEVRVTAADGSFVAEHVPAGRVGVHLMMDSTGAELGRWESVNVVEGETATVELIVRDVLVAGRVTRSGEPVAGVRVRVGYEGGSSSGGSLSPPAPPGPRHGVAITGGDGAYELIADQPGKTLLAVESLDYRTNYLQRTVEIPDADSFALEVALSGVPVSGIVVDRDTGDALARASVSAQRRKDGHEGSTGANTGSDGRFAMEVEPGDYRLTAETSGYARDSVEVGVGAAGTAEIRIALSRGKRIEGRVVDAAGRGVAGLGIGGLSGDRSDMAAPRGWAQSQSDGSFAMDNLPDRPYNLFAGTALAGFAFAAQVAAGETDVVLPLRPAGRVRVSVAGSTGLPVDGAYVNVTRVAGYSVWMMSPVSVTGPDGAIEMGVPQGPIELSIGKGALGTSAAVEVPAEGLATLEVALPAQ